TYYNSTFAMTGGTQVFSGDQFGTQITTTGGAQLETINGDLDVSGNLISLGSWLGNQGIAGLTIQYNDSISFGGALISLTGSRGNTSWLWSEATSNGNSTAKPMMSLSGLDDSLRLYDPTDPTKSPIVLNPSGRSRF